MKAAAFFLLVATLATPVSAASPTVSDHLIRSAAEPAAADTIFSEFGLFGAWASDCAKSAGPDNPHVNITMTSPGIVIEEHDLGPGYSLNRYSVLSAERVAPTRLSVKVIFQPGAANEERQTLVFDLSGGTRRTVFNQADGGPVRVKDGVALARGTKTPTLKKCGAT